MDNISVFKLSSVLQRTKKAVFQPSQFLVHQKLGFSVHFLHSFTAVGRKNLEGYCTYKGLRVIYNFK